MGIKKLIRNLKFLIKKELTDFCDIEQNIKHHTSIMMDNLKYELKDDLNELFIPKIKTPYETIDMLLNSDKSIARFGDGELQILNGENCIFDKPNEKFSSLLKEALTNELPNLMIGIPYCYYHSLKDKSATDKPIARYMYNYCRKIFEQFLIKEKTYYAAVISQMYIIGTKDNYDNYFEKIKRLWKDKDIAIVCGDKVFSHIQTNIFDCARTIKYIYTPTVNASEKYDKILENIKNSNCKLVFLICGPVATALAYDLSKLNIGIRAIDIGHLAKDYDYFINKKPKDINSTKAFFGPEE